MTKLFNILKKDNIILNIIAIVFCIFVINTVQVKAQVAVVVAKNTQNTASIDDVKKMFSGTSTTWKSGAKVILIDQPKATIGDTFFDKLLGIPANKARAAILKLVLSGQTTAPIKANNDDDVKKQLSDNPNAIGFISPSSVDGNVKVLFTLE